MKVHVHVSHYHVAFTVFMQSHGESDGLKSPAHDESDMFLMSSHGESNMIVVPSCESDMFVMPPCFESGGFVALSPRERVTFTTGHHNHATFTMRRH